jgi:uncharacterized protein (TIGR00730 family)
MLSEEKVMQPKLNRICVYCGSNPGRLESYAEAAKALAQALVERNIELVYGGASIGIMGVVADHVLHLGGKVIGVIPEVLMRKEVGHTGLSELHITANMHERKTLMAELSDGFIAMPGGVGTLEELFEIWTWAQLGLHSKPCGVLNIAGYFDKLLEFLQHCVSEQFVKPAHGEMLLAASDPQQLLRQFFDYQAPLVTKWIDQKQS